MYQGREAQGCYRLGDIAKQNRDRCIFIGKHGQLGLLLLPKEGGEHVSQSLAKPMPCSDDIELLTFWLPSSLLASTLLVSFGVI